MVELLTNSGDPDKVLFCTFDLGLCYLANNILGVSRLQCVKLLISTSVDDIFFFIFFFFIYFSDKIRFDILTFHVNGLPIR